MRFIPSNCIREGMILAKPLQDSYGRILLTKGTMLKQSYIKKILEIGYNGVYIEDKFTKDIQTIDVISNELRISTVKCLTEFMENLNSNSETFDTDIKPIKLKINEIINELLQKRDVMVSIIDLKIFDKYTYFHSVNVAVIALIIGISLGYNKERLYELGMGAIVHDIGKVFIPEEILKKPEKLSGTEFEIIKSHPLEGFKYLQKHFDIPSTSKIIALMHHEKIDGSGYPKKLKDDEIHEYAKIVCIADVYDALTSDRPYRKACTPSHAIEYIMGGSGRLFDSELVTVFTKKIAPYPVGTYVRLSNNQIGIVIENFENCCLRPRLRIVKDSNGKTVEPYEINLRDDPNMRNLTIIEIYNDVVG